MIRIEKKHLILKDDKFNDYEINLSGLDTPKKLEEWLCHLTEKNWFCIGDAKHMAMICEKNFGYKYNGKYEYDKPNPLTGDELKKAKQKIENIRNMLKAQNEH